MARNGSGTYSKVNTFVAGNTITAAGHNQNWDDIVLEMTNSVAADGQTTMTGQLKAAAGTVGAPSITVGGDLDSGFYQKAANSIAMALGGADVVVWSTTTASSPLAFVTGALKVNGTLTPTGQILAADGTSALPSIAFATAPNTGFRRRGAAGIGVVLSGADYIDLATSTASFTPAVHAASLVSDSGLTVSAGSVSLPAGSVAAAALAAPAAVVLIETILASATAQIDFTNNLTDATYDRFEIVVSNLKPVTDDVEAWLRVGTGAGPSFQTAGYAWGGSQWEGTAGADRGSGSDSAINICGRQSGAGGALGNAAGENLSTTIRFNNPEVADMIQFEIHSAGANTSSQTVSFAGGGMFSTASAITGLRIMFESGNIVSGRATLYGYTKA